MGIYISGVKGLPEQVQENKENIKDIQEEISGIDWDAIHNLENQVAENTQDINNMEGTIGTQNIAITQLGGRVDDLEDKTQDITRQGSTLYIDTNEVVLNADLTFETDSGSDIKLNPEDIGYQPNKIESTANSNLNMYFNDSGIVMHSNGDEYELINGTIQVNGTPIGGGTLRYCNLICNSGMQYFNLSFVINYPIQHTGDEGLSTKLQALGFNSASNFLPVSGIYFDSNTAQPIIGIYSDGTTRVVYINAGTARATTTVWGLSSGTFNYVDL